MRADVLRRLRRLRDDETGSMVMAMLVIVMASGLMLTVTAYALQGHRSARFDRDHTRVVQGADLGVHEVMYRLNLPPGNAQRITSATNSGGWQTLGDYTYQWTVVSNGAGGGWRVNASGRLNGTQRNVVAVIGQPKPFQHAAFADNHLTFVGANNANSYNATAWNTGEGRIATNGAITLNGNVVADDALVYDWATDPTAARCTSNGNTVCTGVDYIDDKMDVASDAALGFITDATDPANGVCSASPPAYKASVQGALAPGTYCFSTMDFDTTVTFTSTSANPVIVYLTNPTANPTITAANRIKVNCATCTGTSGPQPDAGALQIYTASFGPVKIGNNSQVAGIIYAPRATCRGNPSNAQTQFYGSMVCGVITNQGGWGFHYDARLKDLGAGTYDVLRWSES